MTQKKSLPATFMAGAISGTCSTLLLQPLDLVKTRLQVRTTASATSCGVAPNPMLVRGGMVATFTTVVQHEKLSGLWRGLSPSLSRCVPGVGLYFTTLTALQQTVVPEDRKATAFEALCIGGLARSLTCGALLPITVVKTRFESGNFQYSSVVGALKNVKTQEGFRGLYSGCYATLLRDAPFSGLYYLFYSEGKKALDDFHQRNGMEQFHTSMQFGVGLLAGILACGITHPADVVKTRLQSQIQRSSTISVAMQIYQNEGIATFLHGFAPRVMRRSINAALAWTLFDYVLSQMQLK
ncbi:mitochondrial glycine transporter B-like [Sycon ciliatum]|uniref:mitochondrial glycine transporter B-like n=1 Tax=Sycon ciliatum TaxID=27933 RepID=UPI0020AA6A42|eukprot:scpid73234/ scgid6766/ Solute carrier family 25 member 38